MRIKPNILNDETQYRNEAVIKILKHNGWNGIDKVTCIYRQGKNNQVELKFNGKSIIVSFGRLNNG